MPQVLFRLSRWENLGHFMILFVFWGGVGEDLCVLVGVGCLVAMIWAAAQPNVSEGLSNDATWSSH